MHGWQHRIKKEGLEKVPQYAVPFLLQRSEKARRYCI